MTSRRPKHDPVRVGTALPRVLEDLGFGAASRGMRIQEHWQEAVGEAIAAHAEPGALMNDTLEVIVDSPVWAQQLTLRAPELIASLSAVLGDDAPRELRMRVG